MPWKAGSGSGYDCTVHLEVKIIKFYEVDNGFYMFLYKTIFFVFPSLIETNEI